MIEAFAGEEKEWSDGGLARLVTRGPTDAARFAEAQLCARFCRRVFLYGIRHLEDEHSAFDLVQDVMTLVLERLRADEVRDPDRIASFVLGTARMMARDNRRRARRREAMTRRAAPLCEASVAAPEILDLERLSCCMQRLSERQRRVIVLTFARELSAPQIAEEFGLTPNHVRVIRHRALSALQACMNLERDAR